MAWIFSFLPSQQKRKNSLCELCVSSGAGGETYTLTYLNAKTGTIDVAEGL